MRRLTLIVCSMLAATFLATAGLAVADTVGAAGGGGVSAGLYTVAVVPFEVKGGDESSQEMVTPTAEKVFGESGFTVRSTRHVVDTCEVLGFQKLGVLTDTQAVALGDACSARYVVCGVMEIGSKRTWHLFGPRAKGWAILDTKIVDTASRSVVFQEVGFDGSNVHHSTTQKITSVVLGWWASAWMGGRRCSREQSAVAHTLAAAYGLFFKEIGLAEHTVGTTIGGTQGTAGSTGATAATLAPGTGAQSATTAQQPPSPIALTISMTNGDVMKGTLVAPDQFLIQADYGTVRLKWEEISVLTLHGADTERPDRASLRNGAQVSGWTSPFTLSVRLGGGEQMNFEIARVQSITVDQSAGQ